MAEDEEEVYIASDSAPDKEELLLPADASLKNL